MNTDRFKFRVFDKKTGKYYKTSTVDGSGCAIYQNPSNGYCAWFQIGYFFANAEKEKKLYDKTGIEPDLVVEQCTGVKDKNGNLIYENDRVKVQNATGTIRFGFYRKTAEHFPDSIYGYYIDWDKGISLRQDFGYWVTKDIEIIGNIHTTDKDK